MKLAVLTSGRQDWGILRSTCVALRDHPTLALSLWSGGMHESPAFGGTAKDIASGLSIMAFIIAIGMWSLVFA